jgi:hypothetical protein
MGWLEKIVLVVVATMLLTVATAIAQPLGAESVDVINSTRFDDTTSPAVVEAIAGNVTELSINATSVTRTWAGFFGNITGTLILADSAGNNFYDWNVSTPSGQVYASRSDSVVWTGIGCLDETGINTENTYLGRDGTDPDSINNTYTETNHPSFFVGTTNTTGCPTTQAFSDGGTQNSEFWQVLLADTGSNVVYTTIIEDTTPLGFDGRPWHFQLLVGENGQTNDDPTSYYFYVELQ